MNRKLIAIALTLSAITGPAFAGSDDEGFGTSSCRDDLSEVLPGSTGQDGVHRVKPGDADPDTFETIQAAVDAAVPGDTILISEGTYNEAVKVRTDALRIRGEDRSGVVLDGGSALEIGIDGTGADRLLVENLTAHNYTRHGIYFHQAKGYWANYVTAYNNGLYGIYAFDSRCGQISNSYTSGNADSGFYIGECFPCDAVINDSIAHANAIGYSGTNAGGNLVIRNSIWRENAMGIVPNSLDGEERPPQRGVVIKDNQIVNNSNKTAPGVSIAALYYGSGIIIAGGQSNEIWGNTVVDNALAGITIIELPDSNVWIPSGNTVWGNKVSHPSYPDSIDLFQSAGSGPNNCWTDNEHTTSGPPMLEDVWACGQTATPPGGDPRGEQALIEGQLGTNGRAVSDWKTYPFTATAGELPNQPDDNGDSSYVNDEAPNEWLPGLGY